MSDGIKAKNDSDLDLEEDVLEGIDLDKELEELTSESGKSEEESPKEESSKNDDDVLDDIDAEQYRNLPAQNDPESVLKVNIQPGSQLQKLIEDPTLTDALYLSIQNNEATTTVLNHVMTEIAEEAAYLKTFRRENFNLSEDLSEISERRINILRKLVETIEKREKINSSKSSGKVDFHGEKFQKVFGHFLQIVKKTFKKVSIPPQYDDIFFSLLAKEMDGFEITAEKIYYNKKVK